jgi:heme-degrading monooxygenase HmoA
MYATVTRVQLKPDVQGEGERLWRETTLPAFKRQRGFKGAAVLWQPDTNQGMAVILWESEADRDAAFSSPEMQELRSRQEHLFAGEMQREHYNVLLAETA